MYTFLKQVQASILSPHPSGPLVSICMYLKGLILKLHKPENYTRISIYASLKMQCYIFSRKALEGNLELKLNGLESPFPSTPPA